MKTKDKKKSKNSNATILPEYYHLTFNHIHEKYNNEIRESCVDKSKAILDSIIIKHKDEFNTYDTNGKFNCLNNFLSLIEKELQNKIQKHSIFYWIHLYRRIAPYLASDLGRNTGEATVASVREYAEQAIFKYGFLNKNDDYALSNQIPITDILGGYFIQCMRMYLPKNQRIFYSKNIAQNNPQWVLRDFCEQDIFDIYYIEGLAYRYWYVTAKMRALGKGIFVSITSDNELYEDRTSDQDNLITSFDFRAKENMPSYGLTSNTGTFTRAKISDTNDLLFCSFLNVAHHKLSELGNNSSLKDFTPNYIPWFINIKNYYYSHKYLENFFLKKNSFGLLEFCQFSIILSHLFISTEKNSLHKKIGADSRNALLMYTKFNRSYDFINQSLSEIKSQIEEYINELRKLKLLETSNLESQLDSLLEKVTLTPEKQADICIWSNGPSYIIMKINDFCLYDHSAWFSLFVNLFFGLRGYDPKSQKGVQFEYAFSETAKDENFDVISQSNVIRCNNNKREIDVAIRIANNLYLFECKAFERPLDFILGNPRTIDNRTINLKEKLDQAETLKQFILSNPIGDNYDFSWVENIYISVVSPYTEWIWSLEDDLWSNVNGIPRIMSVFEAISYLNIERNRSVGAISEA